MILFIHLDVRDEFVTHVQEEISPDQLQNAGPYIFEGDEHKIRTRLKVVL